MSAVPEIRMVTLVRAPRDRAYDALTRAEELDAWFTTGAEVDPRPGGEIVWRWVGWGPDRSPEKTAGPSSRRAAPSATSSAGRPGSGARPSRSISTSTRTGSTGWGEALTLLKFYVEHGVRY